MIQKKKTMVSKKSSTGEVDAKSKKSRNSSIYMRSESDLKMNQTPQEKFENAKTPEIDPVQALEPSEEQLWNVPVIIE